MARLLSETPIKKPLILVAEEENLLEPKRLAELARKASRDGVFLEELLIQDGVPVSDVYKAVAKSYGFPFIVPENIVSQDNLPDKVAAVCKRELMIVVSHQSNTFQIATARPARGKLIESLFQAMGHTVSIGVTTPEQISRFFARKEEEPVEDDLFKGINSLARSMQPSEQNVRRSTPTVHDINSEIESSSVVELVNKTLLLGINQMASDIHIESTRNGGRIRFRIDGVLADRFELDAATTTSFVSRLLIMSALDITEKVMPQDGSFNVACDDRTVEFRIACMPGVFGQNIVLRILSGFENQKLNLSSLGMPEDELEILRSTVRFPHGMILVAGPTGSGKSTTLYGILETISNPEMKLITIEDPVERRIEGVQQTQVKINRNDPDRSLTFARGLRTILRLDPDVIMVGEIRDAETAQISVQSSLTGHLVLSTVHANSSIETLHRLQNIGVEFDLLIASLNLIFSQRLLRKLCPHCKTSRPATPREEALSITTLHEVKGCHKCYHTGYSGRTGIFEFLPIVESLKDEINKNGLTASLDTIRQQRLRTLFESAILKVKEGATSMNELERVCGPCP